MYVRIISRMESIKSGFAEGWFCLVSPLVNGFSLLGCTSTTITNVQVPSTKLGGELLYSTPIPIIWFDLQLPKYPCWLRV